MLNSLEIRNYRNLRHLTIKKLGRVNLLVGKNNTGKTSVLEAMAIYASTHDELSTIKTLLQRRGEYYADSASYIENNLTSLSALYIDYDPQFFDSTKEHSGIYIGQWKDDEQRNQSLAIYFRKAYKTSKNDESGREIFEYIVADNEEDIEQREFRYEIKFQRNLIRITTYSLNNQLLFMDSIRRNTYAPYQFQYIDSKNLTQYAIESLYSKIALSDKEIIIINALKLIEPQTERFSLVEKSRPIIKLTNGKIRNISSMGDGVGRVFSIILSMVNAEGTYLLIDEFENGLHYSIQEKLWEVIFYLAEQLDIQVFVTTHSNDSIKSFTTVLAKQEKPDESGKAIRLQLHNDIVRAVDYSPEELETAVEYNIEVR